jgi:hypothetical protein
VYARAELAAYDCGCTATVGPSHAEHPRAVPVSMCLFYADTVYTGMMLFIIRPRPSKKKKTMKVKVKKEKEKQNPKPKVNQSICACACVCTSTFACTCTCCAPPRCALSPPHYHHRHAHLPSNLWYTPAWQHPSSSSFLSHPPSHLLPWLCLEEIGKEAKGAKAGEIRKGPASKRGCRWHDPARTTESTVRRSSVPTAALQLPSICSAFI